ncbi:ChrR family anti-sigma-E factor [Thalassorhabdomicrobium marinisediminis]|uniref:Transcriptional regulator n=1 Tax=Thalassorhabdomicrobium marinisediminis TaxID=2170577 RepID=A0A2T7G0D1_9RHOB|nr:ChrR family anti-sigma-E factor [Thalassorhabdomicrobium marinisediminis]PVA07871.1 transcriptional regulator [Thalassorhabdomicrobium marinisediminis]
MTEIKHHLTDDLLMAYSAGALPEGFSLVVATHISLCDECRARMLAFDAVGGAVVDDLSPVALSEGSFAETLARIDAVGADAGAETAPEPTTARSGVFPTPLQAYVGGDLEAVRWRRVGGGVRQAVLRVDRSSRVRLLHIPAGTAVPDHGHRGTELTLVLQGAFRDEVDHFGTGDIEIATEELDHQPVADLGEDCICLAATDAPLRFHGLLPRIAQPFLGI